MPDPNQPPVRKRRGCLFYGCLTCVVLLLLACLSVAGFVWYLKNRVNAYTDSAPTKLPTVEMSDADFKTLKDRVKPFGDAMDKGTSTEPLVLSEDDINALIVRSCDEGWTYKVHVSLNGDEAK